MGWVPAVALQWDTVVEHSCTKEVDSFRITLGTAERNWCHRPRTTVKKWGAQE